MRPAPTGLRQDCGRTANDWIRRLNEREGISVEAQREIQQSSDSSAKASLSDDETQVCILIRGAFVSWDVAPSTSEMASQFGDLLQDPTAYPKPLQMRHVFTLEVEMANDIAGCLASMLWEHRLPDPNKNIRDIEVVQDEANSETTFWIPSELEIDSHDDACFTLMIDLQTAADLYAVMQEKFWY